MLDVHFLRVEGFSFSLGDLYGGQRKFIDWKKTKLFRFRWNWDEEEKLCGIRLQISSSPTSVGGGGKDFVDTVKDTL